MQTMETMRFDGWSYCCFIRVASTQQSAQ